MCLIDNLRIGGEAGPGTGTGHREYSHTVAVVALGPSENSTQ